MQGSSALPVRKPKRRGRPRLPSERLPKPIASWQRRRQRGVLATPGPPRHRSIRHHRARLRSGRGGTTTCPMFHHFLLPGMKDKESGDGHSRGRIVLLLIRVPLMLIARTMTRSLTPRLAGSMTKKLRHFRSDLRSIVRAGRMRSRRSRSASRSWRATRGLLTTALPTPPWERRDTSLLGTLMPRSLT